MTDDRAAQSGYAVPDDALPDDDQSSGREDVADAVGPSAPEDTPDQDETAILDASPVTRPMWLPSGTAAAPPATAVLDIGPVTSDDVPPASVPRHRRQPWALLIVSILLALTLGLATYLLLTTRAYERRSGQWEAAARTTGSELTQARADLATTTSDLSATRDQLTAAQTRITQLADEKAKLGDDRALQRQLADYQQRISVAAGNVATALSTCIDGQYKLIGYLENASAYNQADLARFRTDVQTVCGAATDANAALQRELKK